MLEAIPTEAGSHKTFGIPEHVETAFTTSLLLHDGDVLQVWADRVLERPDLKVVEGQGDLRRIHGLETLSNRWFTIEWVEFVVVALLYALVVRLDHLGYDIKNDALEEFDWVTLVIIRIDSLDGSNRVA